MHSTQEIEFNQDKQYDCDIVQMPGKMAGTGQVCWLFQHNAQQDKLTTTIYLFW
jgi:hypothetical protein